MKTITPFELQMLMDQRDVELIDVRPKKDFKELHALGARSVPLSRFEPHSVLAHRKLDRRAPLYIMSRERALASLAAGSLAGAGLAEPVVVDGGIRAWEGQCLPVLRNKSWRLPVMNVSAATVLARFAVALRLGILRWTGLSASERHRRVLGIFRLVSSLVPRYTSYFATTASGMKEQAWSLIGSRRLAGPQSRIRPRSTILLNSWD